MTAKGILNPQEIMKAVDRSGDELERLGAGERASLLGKLAIEEILLIFQEKLGTEASFRIYIRTVSKESKLPFPQKEKCLILLKKKA